MDFEQPKTRKEKKGNKEKHNKELYGKYNSKFVRAQEVKLIEKIKSTK